MISTCRSAVSNWVRQDLLGQVLTIALISGIISYLYKIGRWGSLRVSVPRIYLTGLSYSYQTCRGTFQGFSQSPILTVEPE